MLRVPEIQTIIKRERRRHANQPRKPISSSLNGFTKSRMIPKTPNRRCGVINGTRMLEPSRIFFAYSLNRGNRSSASQSGVCCGFRLFDSRPTSAALPSAGPPKGLGSCPTEGIRFPWCSPFNTTKYWWSKIEELADFVRESCSQFFRFAARSDRLADAHNGLITVGVAQRRNDRVCTHSLTIRKYRWPDFN